MLVMHARHPRDGQKEEDSRIYTRLANRRGLEERPSWLVPRKPRLRRTQSDHGARRPLRALTGQAPMPFPPGRFLAAAVDSIPSACQPVGAWRDSPIRVTSSTLGEGQPAVRDEARGGNGIIRMLVPVVRQIINMTALGRPMDAKRLPVWGGEGASAELPKLRH
ncbi:hypothetical protein VTN96DRAFT_5033 [Rasamsonia emersonii]